MVGCEAMRNSGFLSVEVVAIRETECLCCVTDIDERKRKRELGFERYQKVGYLQDCNANAF